MTVYRITRDSNIPIKDRQGYYIEASSEIEALQKLLKTIPHPGSFTVQKWS